jgi:hypothetical protein
MCFGYKQPKERGTQVAGREIRTCNLLSEKNGDERRIGFVEDLRQVQHQGH